MSFIKVTTLVAALAAAGSGVASANAYAAHHDGGSKAPRGGIVDSSGVEVLGTAFTVAHPSVGNYVISFAPGTFASCPAVAVTPDGYNGNSVPLANVYGYSCGYNGDGSLQITILVTALSTNQAMDNAFQFIATPI